MNMLKTTDEALYMMLVDYMPMILYAEGQWSAAAEVATLGKYSIRVNKHTRKIYESLTNNDEGVKAYRELVDRYERALKTMSLRDSA